MRNFSCEGLKIIEASTLIIYKDNKFLLQLRDDRAPVFPNTYAIFGGHAENGETPEQTIIREMAEELEMRLTNPQKHFEHYVPYVWETYKLHIFSAEHDGKNLVLHEGKSMDWFTLDEILDLNIIPSHEVILKKFSISYLKVL